MIYGPTLVQLAIGTSSHFKSAGYSTSALPHVRLCSRKLGEMFIYDLRARGPTCRQNDCCKLVTFDGGGAPSLTIKPECDDLFCDYYTDCTHRAHPPRATLRRRLARRYRNETVPVKDKFTEKLADTPVLRQPRPRTRRRLQAKASRYRTAPVDEQRSP
jgi:hypothetical protein